MASRAHLVRTLRITGRSLAVPRGGDAVYAARTELGRVDERKRDRRKKVRGRFRPEGVDRQGAQGQRGYKKRVFLA
jgi:hypothetical protein